MAIVFVGIDLAKSAFLAVHGVDECGKPVLTRRKVARATGHGREFMHPPADR